jgi:hypothetical protein
MGLKLDGAISLAFNKYIFPVRIKAFGRYPQPLAI